MPQIGWLEILAIVIIAILVLGPKEFPVALKKIGSYFGKLKKGTVAEGIDFHTKCSGPVENLYNEINGGLRSALTYAGAKNIEEFQKNAEFVEVTENYMGESKPRDKQ